MGIIRKIPVLRTIKSLLERRKGGDTLEITTIFPCVNSCAFCPQERWRKAYRGKRILGFDEFCTILEKVPKSVRLDFSGFSEPLMNREAPAMMRHAYRKGYRVALFTSLVGLREEDMEILKEVDFSVCNVHIPDDRNFVVADEARWIEAYRLFSARFPYANTVYHLGNLSDKVSEALSRPQLYPCLTRANNVEPEVKKGIVRHAGPISCSTSRDGFRQNVLMPNGDVYLCCMDWALQHRLGNLLTGSYGSLHESEEYRMVCRSMKDDSIESICRYCERSRSDLYEL